MNKTNENHIKHVVPCCYLAAKIAAVKVLEETYYKELNSAVGIALVNKWSEMVDDITEGGPNYMRCLRGWCRGW